MPGLQAIAEISATRIVDCLLGGTVVLSFASVMARFFKRQSSALRFAVWFSALMAIPLLPLLSEFLHTNRTSLAGGASAASITVPGWSAVCLFAVWASIAAFLLARVIVGLWQLRSLRKTFITIDREKLDPRLRETLNRYRDRRGVSLFTSDRVQVPAAIGLIKPAVVMPSWVIAELSADELNQLLLHELAHLRRRDGWTNLAQQVVKAVFFFHPAVWWIEKKISLEREMACDDAVLAETTKPRAYAECLTHLAEKGLMRRGLALAQSALGRMRQTSLRVTQILDTTRPVASRPGWKTAATVAAFAISVGVLASREPQVVAFKDSQPPAVTGLVPSRSSVSQSLLHEATFKNPRQSVVVARRKALPVVLHKKTMVANDHLVTSTPKNSTWLPESARETALVDRANFQVAPIMSTEAVFVVLDQTGPHVSARQVYEIEIWHFVVLRPSTQSGGGIPHKET